jgi:hypothetical protein
MKTVFALCFLAVMNIVLGACAGPPNRFGGTGAEVGAAVQADCIDTSPCDEGPPDGEQGGGRQVCPEMWTCVDTYHYYNTQAACLADPFCGGTGCYQEINCSVGGCICP